MKVNEKTRSRNFGIILYPEDPQFFEQLETLLSCDSYLYVQHDRDHLEDGNLKKVHIHCVMVFKEAKSLSSVAKKFGVIPERLQVFTKEKGKTLEGYLLYMTHLKETDKAIYNFEEFTGTDDLLFKLKKAIKSCDVKLTNSEKCDIIFEKVMTGEIVSIKQLTRFAIENGCSDTLARNWYFIKELLAECSKKA